MQGLIGIKDAAGFLDRREGTIRKWERLGVMPADCVPIRDERNRRYWTWEQIEKLQNWLVETDRRPGKALSHYKPTQEQIKRHIAKQRTARKE